jgi:hypothetical protein
MGLEGPYKIPAVSSRFGHGTYHFLRPAQDVLNKQTPGVTASFKPLLKAE